jgi:hypothetical protein
MASVDSVQKFSTAFLWPTREAVPLMKDSVENGSCCSAIKARALFVIQIIASIVAIPLTLIAATFIILWKLLTLDIGQAILTLPAAVIHSAYHITFIFNSLIATIAPISWTEKSIDCYELKKATAMPTFATHAEPAPQVTVEQVVNVNTEQIDAAPIVADAPTAPPLTPKVILVRDEATGT